MLCLWYNTWVGKTRHISTYVISFHLWKLDVQIFWSKVDSKAAHNRHFYLSANPWNTSLFRDFKCRNFRGWSTVFYQNSNNQICTVCIMERYIAYGDDSLTLRLVSKLPDLWVANAKWIQWASSLSLVSSSSIIVMHTCASQLWRDIEVVITGLTRNQFVRKHTRVRIPLSPPKRRTTQSGGSFFF